MRFLLLLVTYLLVLPASSHDDDGGTFSQLEEQFQEYRTKLALFPEEFFQLERAIDLLELVPHNGSTVQVDVTDFREKFASKIFSLVEDLFELEADLRELYQDQEESESGEEEEELHCGTWELAMNLNPTDGHIMSYTTGWGGTSSIGTDTEALQKDYLNQEVWKLPANYIAIARHQGGTVEAVKVFQSIYNQGYSLSELFNSSNTDFYRQVVGVEIQKTISTNATVTYDPIFGVEGDLAINWGFSDNGVRMVLTDGYLEAVGTDSYKTRGLGANYYCNPVSGTSLSSYHYGHGYDIITNYTMEIGSTYPNSYRVYAIGSDYGSSYDFRSYTTEYGQYAIYISEDADTFPEPGTQLELEMELC